MREPREVFFSLKQIEYSISRLDELNPFFGTSFLAFKNEGLPIGKTKTINFSQIVEDILQTYYHPKPDYPGFYTPFKTSDKTKRWNSGRYGSTTLQRITSDTFSDTLVHSKGSHDWGWKSDYITILLKNHLSTGLIPAFDLAVWLFRSRKWEEDTQSRDVIEAFFAQFHISEEERVLFDTSTLLLASPWLQSKPITTQSLLQIIGYPPDSLVEEGATLELLRLIGVGPAKQIECKFAPRLNLITGDNGLGKTFLLECAWWALTETWAREEYPAYPRQDVAKSSPSIAFQIGKSSTYDNVQTVKYNWDKQEWITHTKRNMLPGLSIFAEIDGSFAVWDPAKHPLLDGKRKVNGNSEALLRFTSTQVWDGIEGKQANRTISLCNGLIRDWITWQTSDTLRFNEFTTAIKALSPHPTNEPLIPGEPTRLPPDVRPIPTLKFSYGEVPIVLCSAGIQRILALAYLLIWAWHEHIESSKSLRREPQRSIVLLIDEMEAHLHPFWQRVITPALMDVVQSLSSEVQTQLIIATHSPLVLASAESRFDSNRDSLFHLYLDKGEVKLNDVPFVKRGRVDLWLMSDIFGLKQPRSKIAEETIEEAKRLQLTVQPTQEDIKSISDKLINVLAPDDEFWPRWTYFAEQRGVVL
jgi:hypothetical protein